MRKIFIHCGLHKTGTTALQFILFKNRQKLKDQGFHYPDKCIPPKYFGHHNLAWQFSRDRRFRPDYGDFSSLVAEIESTNDDIILSSEDFECSLLYPHKWKKIRAYFEGRNIKILFVIYLRNEIFYLESLYAELLKAGMGEEYGAFSEKVIALRKFNFKEWEFIFNYSDIARSLSSYKNSEVIFRNYGSLVDGGIVADFCHVIGFDCKELMIPRDANKINMRLPLNILVKLFVKNRVGVLSSDVSAIIDELCNFNNYNLRSPLYLNKIFSKISDKNPFHENSVAPAQCCNILTVLNMEKIFSFETSVFVLSLEKSKNNHASRCKLIKEWQGWVQLNDVEDNI